MHTIPADFPHAVSAMVAGAQPKLSVVRSADGSYNADGPDRAERYAICEDLAIQLWKYCARKRGETPSMSEGKAQEKVFSAMARKMSTGEWKISKEEQGWIERRFMAMRGCN